MTAAGLDATDAAVVLTAAQRRHRHATLASRNNALNLIRLVLALAVLVFHAYPLGGFAGTASFLGVGLGGWAVAGFFCLSGYLIQASRDARTVETYLMLRVARIFPAYWVCMVLTALAIAPVAYLVERGTLGGYLTSGTTTPLDYVLTNAFLRINSYAVGDTLAAAPYPVAWNGSLWTLYYEFICYLALAALGLFGWWKRRWPVLAALVVTTGAYVLYPQLTPFLGGNPHVANLVSLAPYFFAGAAVYRWRDRIPLIPSVGVAAAAFVVAATAADSHLGPQASAIGLTVALLYLGTVLPSPAWVRRNDISYGVYIYAFPVQQLLTVLGANDLGFWPYVALTSAATAAVSAASWFAVEQPALRLARRRLALRTGPVERRPALRVDEDVNAARPRATEPVGAASGS